jgi:acyl-CoA dehydrogenase
VELVMPVAESILSWGSQILSTPTDISNRQLSWCPLTRLEWFLARLSDPAKKPFGKQLVEHGVMLERVAQSRIEIDSARFAVLNAAIKIDELDAKSALKEIAEVKVQVPTILCGVIDRAMQAYGGAGLSQDTPLASIWANARAMRIFDGPDEVHMSQLGKDESKKGDALRGRIEAQKAKSVELFAHYGLEQVDALSLNRVSAKAKF